jgi:hypothetical protein
MPKVGISNRQSSCTAPDLGRNPLSAAIAPPSILCPPGSMISEYPHSAGKGLPALPGVNNH